MTHPINIKGGAALDWTRENPGKELVAGTSGSLRIRFIGGCWEYQGKRTQYPVDWERLTDFQWALARSWSAPQRELPPTPEGYRWNVDYTGEPKSLAQDNETFSCSVLSCNDDVAHLRRLIDVYQALIAEYQGRVKL